MTDNKQYPELPDFETVEQHVYGACRRYVSQDMIEPIHNLIRDGIDADRVMRAAEPEPVQVPSDEIQKILDQLLGWVQARCTWECLPMPVARAMALSRILQTQAVPPAPAAVAGPSDEQLIQMMIQRGWKYMDYEERTDIVSFAHEVLSKWGYAPQPQEAATSQDAEDAARYRWLRERISVWRTNDGKGPVSWFPVTNVPASSGLQDETDAAIDQSIAAQRTAHKERP